MENREYRFYAFVSYENHRDDKKWAQWVQRRLENYRVPTKIVPELEKVDGEDGHTQSIPERFQIFREGDERAGLSERSGGPSLGVRDRNLEDSRYLIVVCSPRAAMSARVNDDVCRFTRAGREENIIPFIIDGEPVGGMGRQCYPPSLPADILGVTLSAGSREEALIRVIARLLRLKYSRLYQRHLREQRRFMVRILTAVSAILTVMAFLSVWAVRAEIAAKERREAADELARFLAVDMEAVPNLPAGVRSMIDEKVIEYRQKRERK
ncbi:MAG: hypothetical protein LBT15_03375 [Synergistaceae bacterium]|nr:hypothetical protein [Synergistaceae bacterium]